MIKRPVNLDSVLNMPREELASNISVEINEKRVNKNLLELNLDYLLFNQKTGDSKIEIHLKNPDYVGDVYKGVNKNIVLLMHYKPLKNYPELTTSKNHSSLKLGTIFAACQMLVLGKWNSKLNNYLFTAKTFTPEGEFFYEKMGFIIDDLIHGSYTFKKSTDMILDYTNIHGFNLQKPKVKYFNFFKKL